MSIRIERIVQTKEIFSINITSIVIGLGLGLGLGEIHK